MRIIQGLCRQQIQFTSLDDLIAPDNSVRIVDAFVEKLNLSAVGIYAVVDVVKCFVRWHHQQPNGGLHT